MCMHTSIRLACRMHHLRRGKNGTRKMKNAKGRRQQREEKEGTDRHKDSTHMVGGYILHRSIRLTQSLLHSHCTGAVCNVSCRPKVRSRMVLFVNVYMRERQMKERDVINIMREKITALMHIAQRSSINSARVDRTAWFVDRPSYAYGVNTALPWCARAGCDTTRSI